VKIVDSLRLINNVAISVEVNSFRNEKKLEVADNTELYYTIRL
jgi:hypothetical protein